MLRVLPFLRQSQKHLKAKTPGDQDAQSWEIKTQRFGNGSGQKTIAHPDEAALKRTPGNSRTDPPQLHALTREHLRRR